MNNFTPGRRPLILYVTYVSPWKPAYGGTLRCYGIIKALAEYADLHVAFAGSAANEVNVFLHLSDEVNVVRHKLVADSRFNELDDYQASRTLSAYLGLGKYRDALRKLEETLKPDLVWYFEVEALRRTGLPKNTPFILDHCDVRWRKYLRRAQYQSGFRKVENWLKASVSRFDDIRLTHQSEFALVASEEEIALLHPAGPVYCLPNGFDFPPKIPMKHLDSKRFIFFGSLYYEPNADGVRWMCQEVWPVIRRDIPDAHLDIVGLGHEEMGLNPPRGVAFHGFVKDLSAMIKQAAALVVTLRIGGGTRIKILEAWAYGLPVISTNIGAEGLAVQDGKTVLLADTAAEFAEQCKKCLQDVELRRSLVENAYFHGYSKFDWKVISADIQGLITGFAQSKRQNE